MAKFSTFADLGQWLCDKNEITKDDLAMYCAAIMWYWSKRESVIDQENDLMMFAGALEVPVNKLAELMLELKSDPVYEKRIVMMLKDFYVTPVDQDIVKTVDNLDEL